MPSGLFAALAANVIVILLVVACVKARRKRTPKPFVPPTPKETQWEEGFWYFASAVLIFAFGYFLR